MGVLALLAVAGPAAAQRCPDEADPTASEGWAALQEGELQRADSLFAYGLERCPRHLGSVVGEGYVALRRGEDEAAAARLRQALRLDSRNVDALVGLGIVAWRAGDLAEVHRRFEQVLALEPGHSTAVDYLGRLPPGLGEPPDRPPLVRPDTVVYPARVRGRRFERRRAGGWEPIYIKGVNLGAALPGRYASQFPAPDVYQKWIEQIAGMGANVVRVYTIHPPSFYSALAAHNRAHPENPIWLIHGVWTDLPPGDDFDDPGWRNDFFTEMERVVDLLHGRADIRPRPGHASGFYTADVSPWTLAYIIGREWEPFAVEAFNEEESGRPPYEGRYVRTTADGPADAWMASALEHLVAYEMDTYHAQRPAAYTNWPTLDPLRHSTEATVAEELAIRKALGETVESRLREYDNDAVSLDATAMEATDRMPAGLFASYHAYPYYPDFVAREPAFAEAVSPEGPSSYFGYLRELVEYHQNVPVLIAEYGVPASIGYAHLEPFGFHHGGLTEQEMAAVDARMTREIHAAGAAGGIAFAWIDEWFKKNWLTMAFELPPERNRLWYNRLDAEQHYGLIAWEAVPAVRGESAAQRRSAWRDIPPLYSSDHGTIRAAVDAAYLWLLVETTPPATETVLGFDVVLPEAGDRQLPGVPGSLDVGVEFALRVHDGHARLLVDEGYNQYEVEPVQAPTSDSLEAMDVDDPPPGHFFGRYEMRVGRPFEPAVGDDGSFDSLRVITNRRRFGRDSTEYAAHGYDRGRLLRGSAPDGQWEELAEGVTEIRIPWGLLNFTDPSQRRVLLDAPGPQASGEAAATGMGTTTVDGIRIVGAVRTPGGWSRWPVEDTVATFQWETWQQPDARQRIRPAYDSLRLTFETLGPGGRVASDPSGTPAEPEARPAEPSPAEPPPAPSEPRREQVGPEPAPDSLPALLAAADTAWLSGDTERAGDLYERVLAADSARGAALHRIALIRAWSERYDRSLELFDRLLRLNPENTAARIDRARVVAWQGRLDAAVAALDDILESEPGNEAALQALARFQSWAGEYSEALTAYARLEQLDPSRQSIPYDRARVLAWASRLDEATAVYDSILADSPRDVDALEGKARIHLWAGRTDSAQGVYQRLLEVDPDNLTARRGLARAAAWSGRLDAAEARWRELLEREPDDVAALTGLSQTLRWQGREAAALPVAQRAVELEPRNTDARTELRWVEAAVRPRASPGYAYESDSDGNRIGTLSMSARVRALPKLELRADAYTRSARQDNVAGLDHTTAGGTLTGEYQFESGWTASGSIGASGSDVVDAAPAAALTAATPGRGRFNGRLTVRHRAFDATARLVEQDVRMSELAASGSVELARATTSLDLGLGTARFESEVSGNTNDRWSAYGSISHRATRSLTLAATTRAFGFERDLNDGYFDPDFFGLGEILGRWQPEIGPVQVVLEAAPGIQQVGRDGDPSAVARATARVVWRVAIGREVALSGILANAGLERLSPGSDADYRYRAVTARVRWTF